VWAAFGLGLTASIPLTTTALIELSKLWVISFAIVNLIRTPAEFRFLTIVWLGIFALYPIRGALYNQFICHCATAGRISWNFVFENPNDLAALCLIPIGAAAGVATVERNKFFRLCGLVGVGVLAFTVMLTQSRGAMLAMGVAVILLPLMSRRRVRDLIVLALAVGGAAIVAPKGVWDRLAGLAGASVDEGMVGVDPEGSAESRWQIWKVAASVVQAHPLTGVGIGMMPITHRWESLRQGLDWRVRGERDTHNTYLRIAAETGIPGLMLYLSIWGFVMVKLTQVKAVIRHVRPKETQFLTFLQLSIVAFMTASVFGTYGFLSYTYIMLSFIWLAAATFERQSWYVPPKLAMAPGVALSAPPHRRNSA
ncbi:MAG TPA: O-antigen ligase family protein, partial [Gemmatimonadaceae bacterium]